MTPEQRNAWFTHHAPTEETAPKYAALRDYEAKAAGHIAAALGGPVDDKPARHAEVNKWAAEFACGVDDLVPDGYDKDRAIASIRRARMAANEAIATEQDVGRLGALAKTALQEARWWACSGVACGGL